MGVVDESHVVADLDLRTQVESSSNVLVLAPTMNPLEDELCVDLLTVEPPLNERVLWVTFTHTADERLDRWLAYVGDVPPAEAGIVAVDDRRRSGADSAVSSAEIGARAVEVRTISSPSDLTRIGIGVVGFLDSWEGSPERVVACVHSLTTLLQYAELKKAYRFLHVLTGRMNEAGALAHYHMDPTAHDDRTLGIVKSLFDAVIEVGTEGTTVTVDRP